MCVVISHILAPYKHSCLLLYLLRYMDNFRPHHNEKNSVYYVNVARYEKDDAVKGTVIH